VPLCGIYHNVIFIESKAFTRRLYHLARDSADSVLSAIQNELADNPIRGDVVKGLGGIRKARVSNPTRGKGKRGGFRYLYLYLEHRSHIHLLLLIDKNEQGDLNPEQREFLRHLAAQIREAQ
jgi:mRNA-degrading endonuclease RelE of RelBE toxin-antitoxin system